MPSASSEGEPTRWPDDPRADRRRAQGLMPLGVDVSLVQSVVTGHGTCLRLDLYPAGKSEGTQCRQ